MLLSVKTGMNKILSLLFRNIAVMYLFSIFHISRYKMVKPLNSENRKFAMLQLVCQLQSI